MRSVLKIAIKGIFKRKTYTIAIFFLTIVAAASMVTAISTVTSSQDIYSAAYKKSNSPDIQYFYTNQNYHSSYKDYFKKRSEVKSVLAQSCLCETSIVGTLNGKDISSGYLCEYNPKENNYNISTEKAVNKLKGNEVYVPLLYKSQYSAKVGDKIIIKVGQAKKKYVIVGYFEDPICGSSFMDIKRILFSTTGYKQVEQLTLNKTTARNVILNVYLKDKYQGADFEKTATAVNRDFGKDTLAVYQFDKTMFSTVVLIIPDIIAVVLLCFSVLLLLVTVIVIRHAILSSIEADYVSLGVLKAIGFTGKNIVVSILLQYLIVSLFGTVVGVIPGIFTVPAIGEILMMSTGILETGNLTLTTALFVVAVILIMIALISFLTARKAAKISPVRAISFGKAPMHFSSRLNVPLARLNFLPLSLKMSIKQMMTKMKQYSTLVVITAIFTFMIITVTTLTSSFSSVNKISKIFGYPLFDISISSSNLKNCSTQKLDSIVKYIGNRYGTKSSASIDYVTLRIDNMAVDGLVRSNFDGTKNSLLEGKLPQYDNEIAITPVLKNILGKGVGESVVIEKNGVKKKYMITCILQTISDLGKIISMPQSAYKRLIPDFKSVSRYVQLNNYKNLDGIISALKQKYNASANGISFANEKNQFDDVFNSVQSAIRLASAIVLILTFLLIACITLLLCTITIYREITDTGIFKAIGFNSTDLRLQFSFRFMLISIIGGAIGIILSLLFAEKLIRTMLFTVGIANLAPIWDFSTIGFPLLFVVCVATITAFLSSAKIKKITPSRLITE